MTAESRGLSGAGPSTTPAGTPPGSPAAPGDQHPPGRRGGLPPGLLPAATRRAEWKVRVTSFLAGGLNRLASLSYRSRVVDTPYAHRRAAGEAARCVYASWHCYLWPGIDMLRDQGICTMVSSHRDGELIARVMHRLGYTLARGSSTRGGLRAVRDMIRSARDTEGDLMVTVDGPRGPVREVKEGVLLVASLAGLPIVPIGMAADRAWRLGSWDRQIIPKPFARVVMTLGPEVPIPRRADREELAEVWRPRVAEAMDAAEERAQALIDAG